jgi:predicted alpha-1,2-mannosidase
MNTTASNQVCRRRSVRVISALLFALTNASILSGQIAKAPVDYVSPNIGSVGQMLGPTLPFVQHPYGMSRLVPITNPAVLDRYFADKIYGFTAGPGILMVSTGDVGTEQKVYASDFDRDFETSTPYYYAANLDSWKARAEMTATEHSAIYRFTLPATSAAHFELALGREAELQVSGDRALTGSQRITGTVARAIDLSKQTRMYFYVEFQEPFTQYQTWSHGSLGHLATQAGDNLGFVSTQTNHAGTIQQVRIGISYISVEQAKHNLQAEIPGWDFDAVRKQARDIWNDALGKIDISGGTDRQRTIFYTALYRSLTRMTNVTEDGRYFSGYDNKIHDAGAHAFYTDDGLWDTFRSMHPLQLLLDGKRQEDMVNSYVRMYQQSGQLPAFPSIAGEQAVMIGHHAAQLILDTYNKGYRDFDLEAAYAGMKKNATEYTLLPWSRGPLTAGDKVYFEKGFFPALRPGEVETLPINKGERRQAISITLENSYDDWCVAQLAAALGKHEDETYFLKLAHNYRNLYKPELGLMAPKDADGNWIEPFDPRTGGGQGGRDYTAEVNDWLYTWSVQHDPEGLIELMGGRDKFNAKLDQLFVEPYGTSKYSFLGQFPDMTGLIGMYSQGNEPAFHVNYLYDFSGQPWKAQKHLRQAMDVWYGDGPLGLPGDDDGGETSSWYAMSALGFYPVCPGQPVYEIGSPLFEKASITMGNGKVFTVVAKSVSAQNKYIQSASLNGKPWNKPWFEHADIAQGATLVLQMGPEPNKSWGSRPQDAPPSMTPVPR